MTMELAHSVAALACLLPLTLWPWLLIYRRWRDPGPSPFQTGTAEPQGEQPGRRFWIFAGVALIGTGLWAAGQSIQGWHTDLTTTLWVMIATILVLFLILVLVFRPFWRLLPLVAPYLLGLAILASLLYRAPDTVLSPGLPGWWILAHIALAVPTYGLLTLAAHAGLAVFLQEQALKRKRPTGLTRFLPSVADGEWMEMRLLLLAELLLALDLATGMVTAWEAHGTPLLLDHKTVFSLAGFAAIAALLFARFKAGLRGRRAARLVLVSFLLLSLGYLGVKFVTTIFL